MTRAIMILAMALTLSGCGWLGLTRPGQTFEGQTFRGNAKSERDTTRDFFMASAGPVSSSLTGALLAAEHEGIKHCIAYYGTSDIDWAVGPDAPADALVVENDQITLMGRCIDR